MISLKAKIREKSNKTEEDILAVVYGPKIKNISLVINEKIFRKLFSKAGESSLIELDVDGERNKKSVLVHDIQKDPVSGRIIHVDFYQPDLTKEVEVKIPLVFEGISLAEKDLGGTLNKNILEIEVKALPQNLPREVKVDISSLKTFEDHILVKDLVLPKDVKILKKEDEIVASVLPPQDVEAELAETIEEKVEEVEKVEKKEKSEEVVLEEESEVKKEEAKDKAK